jgi:nitric-oxide synthase, bacterial
VGLKTHLSNIMEFSIQQILKRLDDTESLPILLLEAIDYLRLLYQERSLPETQLHERLVKIYREYQRSQTYWQTQEELTYGAKVAWRNSYRCIGRIFWETLVVRDLRHLTTAEEVFAARP